MSSPASIFILCCLLAGQAAAASPFLAPSFTHPKKNTAQTAGYDAEYDDKAEETVVRFRVSQFCGRNSEKDFTVLTCDDQGRHDGDSFVLGTDSTVGWCWTNSDDSEADDHITLPGNPNVDVEGLFTMTCTLLPAAKQCGLDIDSEIQISATGFVYEVQAYSLFDPSPFFPAFTPGCPYQERRVARHGKNDKAAAAEPTPAPAAEPAPAPATGAKKEAGTRPAYSFVDLTADPLPATIYYGEMYVFSGAFTAVGSGPHNAFRSGRVEYLGPELYVGLPEGWQDGTPANITPGMVGPVKHPFTLTMSFNRAHGYTE